MILMWMLVILIAGAGLAWLAAKRSVLACRWISLLALAADLVLVVILWSRSLGQPISDGWLAQMQWIWIPQIGASLHLAADQLSLILLTLTLFLGIMAVVSSWTEIEHRVGFFHLCLLLTLAGIVGVFTAMNLFLFYFFWELMLVPMYFLIIIWGHESRIRAGLKFFIFTQAGGLFMLISILALYFIHGSESGIYSFEYSSLLSADVQNSSFAFWLMLGFFVAFGVKLPVVPIHVWLPDAHTQAPTAGSVILSGLMLKTGAYGFLRFLVPFFPEISADFSTAAMIIAVLGILYGAALAFAQNDLKRYIACSSVSHMGFILLGISAWNQLALQGVIVVILAHGLSTSALFILAGSLQERLGTRDLNMMGGLWEILPQMGGVTLFLALASLGLPGLANFIGEFLVLLGVYQTSPALAIVASSGLVLSAIYSLWLVERAFRGPLNRQWKATGSTLREMTVFGLFITGIVWIGLFPQPVIDSTAPALEALEKNRIAIVHTTSDTASEAGEKVQPIHVPPVAKADR
jgi:NADH-quinone oxidoreductase subunit M